MTEQLAQNRFVKVKIEYCTVCDYGGHCLHLAQMLRKEVSPDIDVVCSKGRQGAFEVVVNDTQIYSKLQTMALPDYNEVVEVVRKAAEGGEIVPVKSQQPINCVLS